MSNYEADENCRFCRLDQFPSRHFAKYGVDGRDRYPIIQTDNVKVIPDVLPGNPNFHGLIVPNPHRHALAQLPEMQVEIGLVCHQLEVIFREPPAFFEHGGGDGQKETQIQSVYHQHMHAVDPEGLDVVPIMLKFLNRQGIRPRVFNFWDPSDPSPIYELKRLYRGYPYLYVKHGRWGLWVDDQYDRLPSQMAQTFMHSTFSGSTELNWKDIPRNGQFERLSVQRVIQMVDRLHHCEIQGKI